MITLPTDCDSCHSWYRSDHAGFQVVQVKAEAAQLDLAVRTTKADDLAITRPVTPISSAIHALAYFSDRIW
jgi:hypothetical protein